LEQIIAEAVKNEKQKAEIGHPKLVEIRPEPVPEVLVDDEIRQRYSSKVAYFWQRIKLY